MLRFIIITILVAYLLNKLAGFFFRIARPQTPPNFRRPDGSIHVESMPPKEKKKSGLKGGEYVDYEEIK